MRLKKLVAAICFVCITLSACTFKDIKNEQVYLDFQEEKIITVYDNIVYYNNDNDIKIMKYNGNDIIEEIYIDNAKGIYATDTRLYYLKENTIVCKNIKKQTIEKEYSDEKILNAIYRDGKIFYTTGEALKRIDIKNEKINYVSYDPCVISDEYITYVKQETTSTTHTVMGMSFPVTYTTNFLIKAHYDDVVLDKISRSEIGEYAITKYGLFYAEQNAISTIDINDEHRSKKVFTTNASEYIRTIENEEEDFYADENFLYFDTMEKAVGRYDTPNIYSFKMDLMSGVVELVDTETVEWYAD